MTKRARVDSEDESIGRERKRVSFIFHDSFINEIINLGNVNRDNPSVENIFYDAIVISDYCKGFLTESDIKVISNNNKNVFLGIVSAG